MGTTDLVGLQWEGKRQQVQVVIRRLIKKEKDLVVKEERGSDQVLVVRSCYYKGLGV